MRILRNVKMQRQNERSLILCSAFLYQNWDIITDKITNPLFLHCLPKGEKSHLIWCSFAPASKLFLDSIDIFNVVIEIWQGFEEFSASSDIVILDALELLGS